MPNSFTTLANDPVLMTLFLALLVWELAWKGVALWRSAKADHKNWFVLILVLNTAGILPIVYLLMHPRKNSGLAH